MLGIDQAEDDMDAAQVLPPSHELRDDMGRREQRLDLQLGGKWVSTESDEHILAAAAEQHRFTDRGSVTATLCDLCSTCIRDTITNRCAGSSPRWTHEETPHLFGRHMSFQFYENRESMEVSALRGCKLCQLISRGPWQSGSSQMYISVTRLRKGRSNHGKILIKDTTKELWMLYSWMRGLRHHQGFLPVVQADDLQATNLNRREWYFQNTGSEKVMSVIRSWMSECMKTHTPCARKTLSSLPTRVIDVGQANSLDDPYLLEASGRVAPYLALSYCWGAGNRLISTRDSVAKRKEGFTLAELPGTLRDAILVTRGVGVRYLWVDALCIIQDDDRDWQSESSNMRAIYRNALFVISALDAPHSDSGIFYDRTALIASSDDADAMSTSLHLREDPGPDLYKPSYGHTSLNQRAWALQERFMATALVHFSRQKMCWECRACSLFEDGSRRDNHPITKDYGQGKSVERPMTERDWYDVIRLYKNRRLTYPSDKLAAIAGLAAEFEEQGWCRGYHAGLWQSDIVRGLLWSPEKAIETAEQFARLERDPRFPSWSWASSDRHFDWARVTSDAQRFHTPHDVDVEGIRFELSDESKAATSLEGSMTFKAFMAPLPCGQILVSRIRVYGCVGFLDVPTRRPCWLARMATWEKHHSFPRCSSFITSFLLLEEVGDEHVFRRAGIFYKTHHDPDVQLTSQDTVRREITII